MLPHPAIALTLSLLLAATAAAQAPRPVPLGAFESAAQAEQFLMQQSRNGLEKVRTDARARGCNRTPEHVPGVDHCLGVRGNAILDDGSLMISPSRRHLIMADSAIQPLRVGGGVQHGADEFYVLRRGKLARVRISGARARVSATAQSRIEASEQYTPWQDDWNDELHTWQNVVATFDHNRGPAYPTLRTFVAESDGRLTPRDTLIVSGDPPTPLENVATRMLGSHLLIYSAWQIHSGLDQPLSDLVALSQSTAEGEPDASRAAPVTSREQMYRRTYRPTSSFDSTALLNHVHALIDCDLALEPLSCDVTLVLAPAAQRFVFADGALEIVSSVSDRSLALRIPYADSAPSAMLSSEVPVGPSHELERRVELGAHVLFVGPGRGEMRARLVRANDTSRVIQEVALADAASDLGRDVDFGNSVLTVRHLGATASTHYRVGYTLVDLTADSTSNPYSANNAIWFLDVNGSTMSSLGVLRASPNTFAEEADVQHVRQRLGATQALIVGDSVFAIFNEELVEARVVNGNVVEVSRMALFPE